MKTAEQIKERIEMLEARIKNDNLTATSGKYGLHFVETAIDSIRKTKRELLVLKWVLKG